MNKEIREEMIRILGEDAIGGLESYQVNQRTRILAQEVSYLITQLKFMLKDWADDKTERKTHIKEAIDNVKEGLREAYSETKSEEE